METVLIVGATGNIGVSAAKAALSTGRQVLAIVRNSTSAAKLFHHLGTKEGVTTVEADVCSETGVQGVIEQVEAGKLPAFQHVFSTAGGEYYETPLLQLSTEELRHGMLVNFESNFWAYRASVPYLLKQNDPRSTWTICTGAQGDIGARPGPAMTQGALYSMCNAASRDNKQTNIRFNELYLANRVEVDEVAAQNHTMKASEFAKSYVNILSRPDLRSGRVTVRDYEDLENVKWEKRPVF